MVNDNWLYKNIHTLMAANDAISGSVSIYSLYKQDLFFIFSFSCYLKEKGLGKEWESKCKEKTYLLNQFPFSLHIRWGSSNFLIGAFLFFIFDI